MHVSCVNLGADFRANGETVTAIEGLSLESREGEFLSIVGPSGCGKTTLLRIIAGLKQPDRGRVDLMPGQGDRDTQGLLVFQENSTFPWMTALENATFGLEMEGVARAERERKARELFARHGLGGRENAYPHELSAGMKQRVAVIRAFLSDPPLLLMDEPFGALDSQTRAALQLELLSLWRKDRKSVIFVTHDVDEAIVLSDRILVLSVQPGRVVADVPVPLPRQDRHLAILSDEFLGLKREILPKLGMNLHASVHSF
jgi:NitT/TauT family transport system ATP-binding protein